jgi:hypothetical protein
MLFVFKMVDLMMMCEPKIPKKENSSDESERDVCEGLKSIVDNLGEELSMSLSEGIAGDEEPQCASKSGEGMFIEIEVQSLCYSKVA